MLIEEREFARSINQAGAAVRAIELIGKELGMFIDRKEIRSVDEFDSLDDAQLRKLAAERARRYEESIAEDETRH